MIIGIGTDIIEISRFADWHQKPQAQLEKIFSAEEIAYCLSSPALCAQRFAVRFAAKEALFKALTDQLQTPIPFFTVCKLTTITKSKLGSPELLVDWAQLLPENHPMSAKKITAHISLSHSQTHALAFLILEI